jgi:hypothetical protein
MGPIPGPSFTSSHVAVCRCVFTASVDPASVDPAYCCFLQTLVPVDVLCEDQPSPSAPIGAPTPTTHILAFGERVCAVGCEGVLTHPMVSKREGVEPLALGLTTYLVPHRHWVRRGDEGLVRGTPWVLSLLSFTHHRWRH